MLFFLFALCIYYLFSLKQFNFFQNASQFYSFHLDKIEYISLNIEKVDQSLLNRILLKEVKFYEPKIEYILHVITKLTYPPDK